MKILIIILDMVRPDLLGIEKKNGYKEISNRLEQFGGVYFTNSFSPAPDTPRSTACLWSGCYPKKNGCDTRVKYPAFFLKNNFNSLLTRLQEKNFDFNFFLIESIKKNGLLAPGFDNVGYHSDSLFLAKWLNNVDVKKSGKSFTFIHFNDFHSVLNDYNYSEEGMKKADLRTAELLDLINNKMPLNLFDLAFIISDHGFLSKKEQINKNYKSLLFPGRSRILMQLITKENCSTFQVENRLASIMDIYPTILDFCNISYDNIDGFSLFNDKTYDYLLMEDHLDFSVKVGMTIEKWGIKTKNNIFYTDTSGEWVSEIEQYISNQDKELFSLLLSNSMSFYQENLKVHKILEYYKLQNIYPYFSNGDFRNPIKIFKNNKKNTLFKKFFKRLIKALRVILYG